VACGESRRLVCQALEEHRLAVRPEDGDLLPLDIPEDYNNIEAVYILQ